MAKSNALITIMDTTPTPGIEDCLSDCRELVDCWEATKRAIRRSNDLGSKAWCEDRFDEFEMYINLMNGDRMKEFAQQHPEDRLSINRD